MPNAYDVADFAANVLPLTLAMIRPGEDTSRNKHLNLIPCQSHANPMPILSYPSPSPSSQNSPKISQAPHPVLIPARCSYRDDTSGMTLGYLI